ncbi:hypothetical protein HMPREF1705_04761 [Acetomicrobium hydrogeniformans ATCC BAA-1850]|uniref:Uncharacterized protein n=1 Tax=Acetomicrobium hydrogeniformans ATCC BAA-1850 TaxID=592015 RepID=A0A0T5X9P6_9BACT|nr:hypothetical protein HMPREF1705_04761 [Acetomicrobium hydrogeniformans ATCC BAA-1850]
MKVERWIAHSGYLFISLAAHLRRRRRHQTYLRRSLILLRKKMQNRTSKSRS